ncbi:divergent polysaccharide deacetylase family protein [Parashewanella spongiae]|uniref:Divergent polysaccharide deacetylase family protein n=1 Tax=Parashewanella spongiae TaxID=342950 RepID=A0A3A6TPR1_9GAMM|nr:divergent polysaccharide deacetylase family protein [Parashewanella spongiae]MCL1079595.1 divergent polysaccharide deacetylase family protein [Parashewanella spongiae]RJY07259.1 divergent polysaccharide deacetylase family protein [Parashewanella spongiae]
MKLIRNVIFFVFVLSSHNAFSAQIAIIIDDVGYQQSDRKVLSLPSQITLSILPFTPLANELADAAHQKGHEIMLHFPMQSLNGKRLGLGGIDSSMNKQQINKTIEQAILSIPQAKGLNNHMGSLLTQLELPMSWVMETLNRHKLYFIDSSTTRYTRARIVADRFDVPNLKREIFLDNDLSQQGLEKQFKLLFTSAKNKQKVVVIAHPHKQTINFLNANLHRLTQEGIKIVPASTLFEPQLLTKNTE